MEWLFILLLILVNGFFSMSEIALVSSRSVRLEAAVKAGMPGARTAMDLALYPNRFLPTVQIGITLVGLLTGIYSGENFTNSLEAWLLQYSSLRAFADELAVAIVLLIITFATLVLGELVTKQIGLSNPEGISRGVAPLMKLISKIALPFVWVLTGTAGVIMKVLRIKPRKNKVTEEEIKAIIQEGTKGGEVQAIERNIVERVFALGDRKIVSLMTTRSDLIYLDIRHDFNSMVQTITHHLHRAYPVMDNDKDQMGVVFLKDLFSSVAQGKLDLKDAGLILRQLGHIPKVGEKTHWNGFEFEVIDLDGIKTDKIMVRRL